MYFVQMNSSFENVNIFRKLTFESFIGIAVLSITASWMQKDPGQEIILISLKMEMKFLFSNITWKYVPTYIAERYPKGTFPH